MYVDIHGMAPQLRRTYFFVFFTADEEKKSVKGKERADIALQTGRNPNNTQIVWTFGPEYPNMRIATVKKREVRSDYEEHFRDRLQLHSQTGALTITQLRVADSGIYMWQSISTYISSMYFNLTVYSSVASPSITVSSSFTNTSYSSVTMECSVDNSRELFLSWYRGGGRLKETSSPDLSSRLSLPLEIESYDGDNYSCVAENPVDKKTTELPSEDSSHKNGETSSWCQTEATVRLVISAVVGLALIVFVVDHIRLGR